MNDIGYLYVISDGEKVKIGKSKTPIERTNSLVNICGIKNPAIFISNECSKSSSKEGECHKFFSRNSVRGEWFCIPFLMAVDFVKNIAGNEDILISKKEDEQQEKERSIKRNEFTSRMLKAKCNTGDGFNSLFKDTIELVNICEDDSLIDKLMSVNGSDKELLLVRCEALLDVINQQRKLLDFKKGVDNT